MGLNGKIRGFIHLCGLHGTTPSCTGLLDFCLMIASEFIHVQIRVCCGKSTSVGGGCKCIEYWMWLLHCGGKLLNGVVRDFCILASGLLRDPSIIH